nr:MAG TPA: hypothetical protein [Caudoviricetes sp.]
MVVLHNKSSRNSKSITQPVLFFKLQQLQYIFESFLIILANF